MIAMDGNIIIIDYSEFEIKKARVILEHIGHFNITEITSLRQFPADISYLGAISLILMDIMLPIEKNGFDLLSDLKSNPRTSKIPVIVTTKSDRLEHRNAAAKYGVNDYILKPYQFDRLENSIRTVVKIKKEFVYDIKGFENIVMTFDDYFDKELKFAERTSQPLSLILITPNKTSFGKPLPKVDSDYVKQVHSSITDKAKTVLRSTDRIIPNRNSDILIILPATDKQGTGVIKEKLDAAVRDLLKDTSMDMADIFHCIQVTYPEDGNSFESLITAAFKNIETKEIFEEIAAIPFDTGKYVSKKYNQFRSWKDFF